ncbi:hypothetical protein AAG570_001268 [Ranatra chinensis]|uniref:ABC transporter domain-containing protein n=1 Tax=Ranatra chinensis TaxID=642074 RepID=A0ABD0YC41_9HEMI
MSSINHSIIKLIIFFSKQAGISLLHAISVIFALSFVPASFTLYIIEERTSNSKHLQLVSGVSRLIYWIQAYVWDMVCYIISALLCIIIFLIFNEETYISPTNFPGLVLLFFLYGWSCIPLMYPISYLFSIPSSAFVGLACANMFVGIITTVTTFVLGTFDDDELRAVDDIIKEVFLIFPHFCLGDGLMKLATNHMASASLSSMDIEWRGNILEWDYIGKNLTCMFILGIIFFAITLAIEFKLFSRVVVENLKNKVESLRQEDEEEDVKAERLRIEEGNLSDILVIDKLMKVYPRRGINNPSVNRISVGIKQGECFGLLGLNGAGKTSTFKMLTGAINVTSGDAYVKGHSIVTDIGQARSLMGYCPQFDALDPLLTPREHLIFYATIRNIPSRLVQKVTAFYVIFLLKQCFYCFKL